MKNKYYYLITVLLLFLQLSSCKKDNNSKSNTPVVTGDLISFDVNGELYKTENTYSHTIDIIVPDNTDPGSVTVTFSTSNSAKVVINNSAALTGQTVNASNNIILKVVSATNSSTVFATWNITVTTEDNYIGLGNDINAKNSQDKSYNYYFDQFDGSTFQAINCGPTVTSMAIKWADSTFTGTPLLARTTIAPGGGWWTTDNISNYLNMYGINNTTVPITNMESLVQQVIDNGDMMILCLDMYYVSYNGTSTQHTNKFYGTYGTGWGHFLLVKGYEEVDGVFYLDIYDPYSNHNAYSAPFQGQLKGQDRYYESSTINAGTSVWWQYAIVLAPKGKQVVPVLTVTPQSISPAKIPVAKGQ